MGAPMGNKNAAGSHTKGWYKKSKSSKKLKTIKAKHGGRVKKVKLWPEKVSRKTGTSAYNKYRKVYIP